LDFYKASCRQVNAFAVRHRSAKRRSGIFRGGRRWFPNRYRIYGDTNEYHGGGNPKNDFFIHLIDFYY
jgi:hypothetical protein